MVLSFIGLECFDDRMVRKQRTNRTFLSVRDRMSSSVWSERRATATVESVGWIQVPSGGMVGWSALPIVKSTSLIPGNGSINETARDSRSKTNKREREREINLTFLSLSLPLSSQKRRI